MFNVKHKNLELWAKVTKNREEEKLFWVLTEYHVPERNQQRQPIRQLQNQIRMEKPDLISGIRYKQPPQS